MLSVLYFADRDVRRKLFERVDGAAGLLLVTAAQQGKQMKPVAEREPFASLERDFGDVVSQLVVADEGTVEGMWRDPVGDLADALFPHERSKAYLAASGYLLLSDGKAVDVVKRHGSVRDDHWFLQEALSRLDARIPAPEASARPGPRRRRAERTDGRRAVRREPANSGTDPWALLGLTRQTPLPAAKKAFRALIAQYHPDKVAHLAPEFRELAEERTRQILAAWEEISGGR